MFGFIKKCFFTAIMFFVCNSLNVNAWKCVSVNNQECRVTSEIIIINSNGPSFYPFSIEVNKRTVSCNNIDDRYAKLYVPDIVKNINVKVFNLMLKTNEKGHIE